LQLALSLRSLVLLLVAAVASSFVSSAWGSTLRANQVLVVYDSRVADSVAVAEHYAGSALVPGGTGGEPGVHEGLLVFDIASSGLPSSAVNGTLPSGAFISEIRDPIRAHLIAGDLVYRVRSIVLCKGLPHRVDDAADPGVGDRPSDFGARWGDRLALSASVDSELALLWQDLDTAIISGTVTADKGYIRNPYWRRDRPINTYSTKNIRVPKAWRALGLGQSTRTFDDVRATSLTPGDILLVCRLDGNSVAAVRGMVERAQGLVYDTDASGFVLDESGSNGIADLERNGELDNVSGRFNPEDDYETARDELLADGRFDPAAIFYNERSNGNQFSVGPNVDYEGQGLLITDPIVLLTHYGRNHAGRPTIFVDRYEESFNLLPGAVFSTMESFNGRAFNGLGTRFDQGQVADFIEAGGTFGIGMVWEPFANTVPDSAQLVRQWFLGRYTWAEAAYMSINTVSWHHVVVGDPLARALRTSDDIDGNGVLDIDDLYAFTQNPVDLNRDGVADDTDRELLTNAIRVPIQETFDAGRQ
jgi:hypothetical protein